MDCPVIPGKSPKGKRGITLHINGAYEHTPIVPYQPSCEEASTPSCPTCGKHGVQCVDVSQPLVLTPSTDIGTLTTSCQGTPEVTCVTNAEGTACTVTLTQRVCVTIPVTYSVDADPGSPSIACADGECGCACGM